MVKKSKQSFDHTVFMFQGGGALGAYQVGVYKALHEHGYVADWLIGTSIGSVNSAIIAGNRPQDQVKKLEQFWTRIATMLPPIPDTLNNIFMERVQHFFSARYTELNGQDGFFKPRPVNPWLSIDSTADKLSYYDCNELRETLLEVINFDIINEQKTRLSMGSVRIATGDLVYFDNTKIPITVDHVMASCALPPGFPAVAINNQFFWDGGVHSNNQLNLLLTEREPVKYLCFMVNLFDSYGTRPFNMDDVLKRQKDITYSSRHKQAITIYRSVHNLKHAIRVLSENLSKDKQQDPELRHLIELGQTGIIHLARFHYKGRASDLSTKDYDFSMPSIREHIKSGYNDVNGVIETPPWNTACPKDIGLVLYEVSDAPIESGSPYEEPTNFHIS